MTEQQQPKEEPKPIEPIVIEGELGEAGGIAFTTVYKIKTLEDGTNERLEINLTGRGHTAMEAMQNLFNGLAYAHEQGYTAWRRSEKMTPLPAQTPVAGAMATLPGATTTPAAAQPPVAPPAGSGAVFKAEKMVITPRADGKVDIEFFAANHQYHDLKTTKTVDAAIAMLAPIAPFTAANFSTAATYPVSINVRYVNSEKLNKAGNPYKDLVDITPAG